VRKATQRELHALAAHPQPHLTDGVKLAEALEDRADRAGERLVGIDQDLAVLLAPDKADRQPAAQLAARGLVSDPAFKARSQHVQLGLAHRALEAQAAGR
jgi:hypothetical protein